MKTRLHKKQQNCNKLLTLFTMGIALLTGVVAMGISTIRESYHQAKAVSYDDEEYTIIFSADELNNYHFVNLANYINSIDVFSDIDGNWVFTYGSSLLTLDENLRYDSLSYEDDDINITFFLSEDQYLGAFVCNDKNAMYQEIPFDTFLILNTQDTFYTDVKLAIEQDIQANQPIEPTQPMLDFVSIIVSGIGAFASGVASGVSDFASALFLKVENGTVVGLSVFGGILAIFAGLALAVGITIKVYNWITTLGN